MFWPQFIHPVLSRSLENYFVLFVFFYLHQFIPQKKKCNVFLENVSSDSILIKNIPTPCEPSADLNTKKLVFDILFVFLFYSFSGLFCVKTKCFVFDLNFFVLDLKEVSFFYLFPNPSKYQFFPCWLGQIGGGEWAAEASLFPFRGRG